MDRNTDTAADRCPTCLRPVNNPYRRIVDGRIVEGCIDDTHTGRIPAASNTGAWHNRPVAKAHRRAVKVRRREILR
jgi:hypothetical protein